MKLIMMFFALFSQVSFATISLNPTNERIEFEQYIVSSTKAAKVVVKVDSELKRVDCHGLGTKYLKSTLTSGEILINKIYLYHPMNVCLPNTDYIAKDGIEFTVNFENKFGGQQIILVPVNSKVEVSSK